MKGFTEALIDDFRFNALHLKASLVMLGYIGSQILRNTGLILGQKPALEISDEDVEALRERWTLDGSTPMSGLPENARTDKVGQQ